MFHPEDELSEILKKARESYEKEMEFVNSEKVRLDRIIESIPPSIPEEYRSFIDSLFMIFYRVGVNHVEIKQNEIKMYELFDELSREIDRLSERIAGLDKER